MVAQAHGSAAGRETDIGRIRFRCTCPSTRLADSPALFRRLRLSAALGIGLEQHVPRSFALFRTATSWAEFEEVMRTDPAGANERPEPNYKGYANYALRHGLWAIWQELPVVKMSLL
jgi:hypothetical protein